MIPFFELALYAASFYAIQLLFVTNRDWRRGYSVFLGLRGPPELPFFKCAWAFVNMDRMYEDWLGWWRQFGDVFFLRIPFSTTRYALSSPDALQHIHKTHAHKYKKADEFIDILKPLLGDGIFAADDELWRDQRKTISHLFTGKNFRDFFLETFWQELDNVSRVLRKHAIEGTVLDLQKLFHIYTMESFAHIGFGLNLDLFNPESPSHRFAKAFDEAQTITDRRFFNPFWKFTERITGVEATLNKHLETMREFTSKVIADRRANGTEGGDDILCRFMEKSTYSDRQLHDIVINMIIAGRDTTAQALSWTIYELSRNPDDLAKIRQEIQSFVTNSEAQKSSEIRFTPNEGSRLSLSYADFALFPYTRAVIQETLRLYPSVPKQAKVAVEDDYLPDGTFVPKGSWVAWSSWAMGRLESVWGKDAEEFKPQRFIDEMPSQFKFPAFNMGSRLCLGMNMAYMEATLALILLLDQFDIEVVDKEPLTYLNALTLPIKNGLHVRVKVVKR